MIRYECSICGQISPPVTPDRSTVTLRNWLPHQEGWTCYNTDSNGDKYACEGCSEIIERQREREPQREPEIIERQREQEQQ